jgi:thymidylate kinase
MNLMHEEAATFAVRATKAEEQLHWTRLRLSVAEADLRVALRERDEARAALEEREGDMHVRIREGYDKTVADSWRAHCAKIEAERDEAMKRAAAARERGPKNDGAT